MALLHRTHAEVWQENETSIVLKQLDDSLRHKDSSRFHALQKSLLEIERRSDKDQSSSSDFDDFSLCPMEPQRRESAASVQSLPVPLGETMELMTGRGEEFSASEKQYLEKAIRQNVKQYDVQFNVLFVGDSQTGKTSIMRTMIDPKFASSTPRSTGYPLLAMLPVF